MDTLRSLIGTLSKSEKRAFKLLAKRQQADKAYIELFDSIEAEQPTDEFVPGATKERPFVKNYLQSQLIEVLRLLYSESSPTTTLLTRLTDIHLLIQRKQFVLAWKLYGKATKLAEESSDFVLVLKLLECERMLPPRDRDQDKREHVLAIRGRQSKYAELNRMLLVLQEAYDNIYWNQMSTGSAMTDAVRIDYDSFFAVVSDIPDNLDFRVDIWKKLVAIRYYQAIVDPDVAVQHSASLVAHFKSNPRQAQYHSELFKRAYGLHSFNLVGAGSLDEALHTCQEFKRVCGTDLSDSHVPILALIEFNLLLDKSDIKGLDHLSDHLTALLGTDLGSPLNMAMRYCLARIAFLNDDFVKTLDWLEGITSQTKHGGFDSIYASARGMHLIIHFELGNHDYLKYAIRAYKQFLKRTDHLVPVTDALLTFLARSKKPTKHDYLELEHELINITFAGSSIRVMETTELNVWLTSKTRGISIREAFTTRQH